MTTKFTPGPWVIYPGTDGTEICAVDRTSGLPIRQIITRPVRGDNWIANATLLAAAPELYQAVAMLVEWWGREDAGPQYSDPAGRDGPRGDAEQQEWFYGNVNLAGETHRLARAALAKARGEA